MPTEDEKLRKIIEDALNPPETSTITNIPNDGREIIPNQGTVAVPNDGRFTVAYYSAGSSATNTTKQKITIYSSMGQRVYNEEFNVSQPYQLHQIDLRRNSAGTYYVVLREANGNRVRTGKIVVK